MGIPAPNVVIYLKVDPEISQKLMSGRYHGDERRKDIHEKDVAYLKKSREAAEYCCEKLGWKKIECSGSDGMRSIEEIQKDIVSILQSIR